MAIHDYNIANGSGINVRSDLNAVLAAILSQNSSATEPTTTAGGMFWYDTTTGIFKQRNSTNTGWVDKWDTSKGMLATLNSPTFTGPVNLPTTTYIGGYGVATTQAPIFSGNSVFESLTAWSSVSLPASTTIGGVSATELSYLDGVTSAIQSQLNAKQPTLVNQTNIKSINNISLLGGGNIDIVTNLTDLFANVQVFAVSGIFTVPAGVTKVMVIGIHAGAGGGGGGGTYTGYTNNRCASGGGGGASVGGVPRLVEVTPGETIAVTVGNGGAGGAGGPRSAYSSPIPSGGNGGAGGDSYFGNILIKGSTSVGLGGSNCATSVGAGANGGGGGGSLVCTGGNQGSILTRGGGSVILPDALLGVLATSTGGVCASFGALCTGGVGETGDGNNGTAAIDIIAGATAGGAGGSGGSGKVIVYW